MNSTQRRKKWFKRRERKYNVKLHQNKTTRAFLLISHSKQTVDYYSTGTTTPQQQKKSSEINYQPEFHLAVVVGKSIKCQLSLRQGLAKTGALNTVPCVKRVQTSSVMIFTLIFSSVIGGELWKKGRKSCGSALLPSSHACNGTMYVSSFLLPFFSPQASWLFTNCGGAAVTFTKDFFEKISSKFSIYTVQGFFLF